MAAKKLYALFTHDLDATGKNITHGNTDVFINGSIPCVTKEFDENGDDEGVVYELVKVGTFKRGGVAFTRV